MKFPKSGKWWASRKELAVEKDGTVTVALTADPNAYFGDIGRGDFTGWMLLTGEPETLRRVAKAIEAQVDGAIANTPGTTTDEQLCVQEQRDAQQLAAFRTECAKVGIPHDAEGLVRHHRGNAGFAAACEAEADFLGRLSPETRAKVLAEIRMK